MKTPHIVCYGEILLRFIIENDFGKNKTLPYFLGGSELNVARHLANFDISSHFTSVLPANFLSEKLLDLLKNEKINTNNIFLENERIGIFYAPKNGDMQNQNIIYDRLNSAFYKANPTIFNWTKILQNKHHFHTSAISPALNKMQFKICLQAFKTAVSFGLNTSLDLNYRKTLWQYTQFPHKFINQLLPYCNTILGNIWAVEKLVEIKTNIQSSAGVSIPKLIETAELQIKKLIQKFPNIKNVAYTFRLEQYYFAILYMNNKFEVSTVYNRIQTSDSVGSGDSFMAALLYGIYKNLSSKKIAELCCQIVLEKLSKEGDFVPINISIKN
ncbi:MAG: PfkB family carbohydrate kinase [Sediminibacterium sp.]|nr:PfkB family carbohydrate kinase [Sediminibacterium sp.]